MADRLAAGLFRVTACFDTALKAAAAEAERLGAPVAIVDVTRDEQLLVDADRRWWRA